MYKSVIFDVDGTLIDTEKPILISLQKVVEEELNEYKELNELSFSFGLTDDITFKMLGIKNMERATDKWREYIKKNSHLINVFKDIEDTLKMLNDLNIYTGIVTSRTEQELVNDLYPLHLHEYMRTIISADATTKHKPDPEPILKFLEVSKIDPSSAIYIGDTIYDMKCAGSAGIDFALAHWGAKSTEGIDRARFILENPSDILKIVGQF